MMIFLADQDVYWLTIQTLRAWGHEVHTAGQLQLHRSSDEALLSKAEELSAILVTRDKDFGALAFLKEKTSTGIMFLRCSPQNLEKVHGELRRLLSERDERELRSCFCVIEHNRYRIRRLKTS